MLGSALRRGLRPRPRRCRLRLAAPALSAARAAVEGHRSRLGPSPLSRRSDTQGPQAHLLHAGSVCVLVRVGRRGQHALSPALPLPRRRSRRRGGQRQQPRRGPGLGLVHQPPREAPDDGGRARARRLRARAHPRSRPGRRRRLAHRSRQGQRGLARLPRPRARQRQVHVQDRLEGAARAAERGQRHRLRDLPRLRLLHVLRADHLREALGLQARAGPQVRGQLRCREALRRRGAEARPRADLQARRARPPPGVSVAPRGAPRPVSLRGHAQRRYQ